MKIAYIVSRFPSSSETFIARELNHVAMADDVEIEIHSLFPATEALVHPSAKPWVDGVKRPSPAEGARDLGWWLVRRPGAVLGIIGTVHSHLRATAGLPRSLARHGADRGMRSRAASASPARSTSTPTTRPSRRLRPGCAAG